MLVLGLSLAPVLCWAAEPKADQPSAPPIPQFPPPQLVPQPERPVAAAVLLPKSRDNDAAQLKAVQEERIKVLTQLVELETAQYKVGATEITRLVSAENELCDALFDSTDDIERRIALLTKQVERANDLVRDTEASVKHGAETVTEVDVCRAKSLYLGLTIKLLRERGRKGPPMPTPPGK
jgi:hypothetical protein